MISSASLPKKGKHIILLVCISLYGVPASFSRVFGNQLLHSHELSNVSL